MPRVRQTVPAGKVQFAPPTNKHRDWLGPIPSLLVDGSRPTQNSPIIICGFPRTGTTFLGALLASHPDIAVSEELRLAPVFPQIRDFAQSMKAYYDRPQERWRSASGNDCQAGVVKAAWFCSNPAGLSRRRVANKTPEAELHAGFYDEVFKEDPPLYVYGLRRGIDVFASFRSMPWGRESNVSGLIDRFLNSIDVALEFKRRFPERIHIVQIDKLTDQEQRRSAALGLFSFIGEHVVDEVHGFVDAWPAVNRSAPASQGIAKEQPLSADEVEAIVNHELLAARMAEFGYQNPRSGAG